MDKHLHIASIRKIIKHNDFHVVDQLNLAEKSDLLIAIIKNYAYKDSPIFDYLLEQKIDLNYFDINDNFPVPVLGYAAERGDLNFCNKLLDNGANMLNANNACILIALSAGQLDVLKLFISRGLDVSSIKSITVAPAGKGHTHILKYLIEDCHIRIHHKGLDLINACRHGKLNVVQYLISQGANPFQVNNFGEDSMVVAAFEDNLPIIQYFAQEGYDIRNALLKRPSQNVEDWVTSYLKNKELSEKLEKTLLNCNAREQKVKI